MSRPTGTPYPTYTPWPTYTPYPTWTPQPTGTPTPPPLSSGWDEALVLGVVDGDTILVLLNGQTSEVRYIGIDAPEAGQPCYEEATRFNAYLVTRLSPTVYLERDVSEEDDYGRLLRYVWLPGAETHTLVNAEMVSQGYAIAKAYPPDLKYQSLLQECEQQARQNGQPPCRTTPTPPEPTITAETPTPTAQASQSARCPEGCTTPPPGCLIKGNISSSSGEKIYHLPGQQHYDQTTIDPSKGERWFCTEEEAVANGWRKSKR